MMHFILHLHGMADQTVAICPNGQPVVLVLQRLEDIQLRAMGIFSRINSVGTGVAGGAKKASAFIDPVSVQVLFSDSPFIINGLCLWLLIIDVAVETVRLINPWLAWKDSICLSCTAWVQAGQEFLGLLFAVCLFLFEQTRSMILQVSMAVVALHAKSRMNVAQAPGCAVW